MLKHLDYLMLDNGGCDPFHYMTGNGGLGYKPHEPYIHGVGSIFNSYKNKFNTKHHFPKDQSHTLIELSKLSGYDKDGLQTIYNKGIGAYHTNPQSVRPQVKSPEQWAMARVYAAMNPKSKAHHVDKSHLIKHIRGGMAGGDPDDPRKIFLGTHRFLDSDNNTLDVNDDIIERLEELASKKDPDTNRKLKEFIANEMIELKDIENEENHNAVEKYRTEYIKILKEMNVKKPEYNKLIDKIEDENVETDDLFTQASQGAKTDVERGDNTEVIVKNKPQILSKIDGDTSDVFNTKDINASYYNPEFIQTLRDIYGSKKRKENFEDWVEKEYLQYMPVDFMKKNTIWELKSHKDNKKDYQPYAKTKIEGYRNPGEGVIYDLLYDNNSKNPNKKMLKNIYFSHEGQSVPVLVDNPKGYNFLTLFNNQENRSYYNAMVDKKLETNDLIQDDKIELLKIFNLASKKGIAKDSFDRKNVKQELMNAGYDDFEVEDMMRDLSQLWSRLRAHNKYGNDAKLAKLKYPNYQFDEDSKVQYRLSKKNFNKYSDNLLRRPRIKIITI